MALSDDLKNNAGALWEQVVRHPFVIALGDGTLPPEVFRVYFQQDYLFLRDWMVLLSLGIAKSPDFDAARSISTFLNGGLAGEEGLFRQAFRDMGMSQDQVAALEPLPTTLAYGGFLRAVAHEGTFLEIAAALLAIEWPYLEWAQMLNAAGKRPSDPYYQAWIDIHASQEMQDIVAFLRQRLDTATSLDRDRITEIFVRSMRYEYLFWEMAYRGESWP